MPVARYKCAVSVLNNSLVVMGGWNPYTAEDIKRVDVLTLATSRSLPIFETSCTYLSSLVATALEEGAGLEGCEEPWRCSEDSAHGPRLLESHSS